MNSSQFPLTLLFSLGLALSCSAQNPRPENLLRPGTLLQNDFENGLSWLQSPAVPVGTIDVAGSTAASLGLKTSTALSSGSLALKNTETNLGKLTLAFSLSASAVRPVTVRVESFDKAKKRTGGLETLIYPAAPDFYQRYALDLNTFKSYGTGKFAPAAPFHSISLSLAVESWKDIAKPEIRLDNVQFAKPAFYVSASGSDKSNGRTEKTAFATPQKALDMAQAGDIVVVMNGTYLPTDIQDGIASFRRPGTPAGWISIKPYPGHKPLFQLVNSWAAVRIGRGDVPAAPDAPAMAYLEARGLRILGQGDVAKAKYPESLLKADPRANGNGIMAGPSKGGPNPHHLRFADNIIEFCPGAGIAPSTGDWFFVENNIVRNNCWPMRYAGSGISIYGGVNFDGTIGGYRNLISGNIVSGNRTFEPWAQIGKVSDGNGIIIDVNQNAKLPEEQRFTGRTLIANNLSFNNGGSGIHAYKSKRVDIINNTVYLNSASPELTWGQLFVQQVDDVRMINNIVVAPLDQPVNTVGANSSDQNSKNVVRANNLYFGGATAPIMGEGDKIGDPLFVNPSIDAAIADFRLKPGSPALKVGRIEAFSPLLTLDGKPRPLKSAPDAGAFQR